MCVIKMGLVIEKAVEIVERLGLAIGHAALMTYPKFLIWKDIKTDIGVC